MQFYHELVQKKNEEQERERVLTPLSLKLRKCYVKNGKQ